MITDLSLIHIFSEKTESVEAVGDKSTTEKSNADDSVLYSVSEGTAILLSQVDVYKRQARKG